MGWDYLDKRFLVRRLQERGVFMGSTLREVTGSPAEERGRAPGGWVGVYLIALTHKRRGIGRATAARGEVVVGWGGGGAAVSNNGRMTHSISVLRT